MYKEKYFEIDGMSIWIGINRGTSSMKRIMILLVLLFVCVGCDQSTKYTAKHYLQGRATLSYLGDVFRLSYTENSGAFLSMGADLPDNIRRAVFVVLTSVFLFGFLIFVIRNHALNAPQTSACALIIGGGLGNLIDRVVNQGAVIDFMNIGIGPIRTGIFNVADVAITAGALMFMVFYMKTSGTKSSDSGGENEI